MRVLRCPQLRLNVQLVDMMVRVTLTLRGDGMTSDVTMTLNTGDPGQTRAHTGGCDTRFSDGSRQNRARGQILPDRRNITLGLTTQLTLP